jgi:hypothetical protein
MRKLYAHVSDSKGRTLTKHFSGCNRSSDRDVKKTYQMRFRTNSR